MPCTINALGCKRLDAPLAQLDRASDFESEGREFESLRARQYLRLAQALLAISALLFRRGPCCEGVAASNNGINDLPRFTIDSVQYGRDTALRGLF